MDDLPLNIVMFRHGPDARVAHASVDPRDENGVQRAWERIVAEEGVDASDVTAVDTRWQPSPADLRYIEQTFGHVDLQHTFARPEPENWESALDQARRVIEVAVRELELEELADKSRPETPFPISPDPATNVIQFVLGSDDDHLVESAPAQAVDGFRRAWERVAAEHGDRAGQVTAVRSSWEPSVLDRRYLGRTFGNVEVSHFFDRPAPGRWDDALEHARTVAAEIFGDGDTEEAEPAAESRLLPILRSGSLEGSDAVREMMPWLPVVGEDLFATFAHTGPTPWGTIGMHHVLRNQLDEDNQFTDIVVTALDGLVDGLRIEVLRPESGGHVVRMSRRDGIGAGGAVLLPDFHERVSETTGWRELIVAITCPDVLWAARAGSPEADHLAEEVRSAEQQGPEMRPTLLKVTADGIELVAEGGR